MHHAKLLRGVVLVVGVLILPLAAPAVNLPHYDLDSLAYMSTDIVIATLSVGSQRQFTATVADILYGNLKSGDRLETLSQIFGSYLPMENGQRVILFLDRRPRRPDFFNPEGVAVLFSGVYLIDAYEHVHQYYQESNPGGYAAEGYRFFLGKLVPAKEQDLALPTLADVTSRIAASLKSVQPLRPLLDKAATRDDATAPIGFAGCKVKRPQKLWFGRDHRTPRGSVALVERSGNLIEELFARAGLAFSFCLRVQRWRPRRGLRWRTRQISAPDALRWQETCFPPSCGYRDAPQRKQASERSADGRLEIVTDRQRTAGWFRW
jgi:hypothetical protein